MKKIFLTIIFFFFYAKVSCAEIIALSKCFILKDSNSKEWLGPWKKVWGEKKKFDKKIFEKKQFIFDTLNKELKFNYRFTNEYHAIVNLEDKFKKAELNNSAQEYLKNFKIPIELNIIKASEKKGYSINFDHLNQSVVFELKLKDYLINTINQNEKKSQLINKGLQLSDWITYIEIDLKKNIITEKNRLAVRLDDEGIWVYDLANRTKIIKCKTNYSF